MALGECEEDEVGRLQAEYQAHTDKLAGLETEIAAARAKRDAAKTKGDKAAAEAVIGKLQKSREKLIPKVAERDGCIAEARRRAEDDRQDMGKVGDELAALHADPDELRKHARVVGLDEIEENEFNLNIPLYVDTFEPEPRVEVQDALKALRAAELELKQAENELNQRLRKVGYAG
jgi:type I restriction enzyme M protein